MKAKIALEIENCTECPFHERHQVWTPDSFDHEYGIYCSRAERLEDAASGKTSKRLVVADEWDPGKYAEVPSWCPFIIREYQELLLGIHDSPIWRKYMDGVTANPLRFNDLIFDYGEVHAKGMIRHILSFFEMLERVPIRNFIYRGMITSSERDAFLASIAASLCFIGAAGSIKSDRPLIGLEIADNYFLDQTELAEEDRAILTNAILHWFDEKRIKEELKAIQAARGKGQRAILETETVVKMALFLADKLDVSPERVERYADGCPEYAEPMRPLIEAMKKVEKVEFFYYSNEKGSETIIPSTELCYTVQDGFDPDAISLWPELVMVPRTVARDFLGAKKFVFRVNGERIHLNRIQKKK